MSLFSVLSQKLIKITSSLSLYVVNDKKVSDYLNKEWINDIEKDMIDIIYNNVLSKEDKILTFNNKINIRFQSYITYIINHIK